VPDDLPSGSAGSGGAEPGITGPDRHREYGPWLWVMVPRRHQPVTGRVATPPRRRLASATPTAPTPLSSPPSVNACGTAARGGSGAPPPADQTFPSGASYPSTRAGRAGRPRRRESVQHVDSGQQFSRGRAGCTRYRLRETRLASLVTPRRGGRLSSGCFCGFSIDSTSDTSPDPDEPTDESWSRLQRLAAAAAEMDIVDPAYLREVLGTTENEEALAKVLGIMEQVKVATREAVESAREINAFLRGREAVARSQYLAETALLDRIKELSKDADADELAAMAEAYASLRQVSIAPGEYTPDVRHTGPLPPDAGRTKA